MLEQIIKNIEKRDFFEFRHDEDSDQNLWFVSTGFIPDNAPVYFEDQELIKATEKMVKYLCSCYDSDSSKIGKCLRSLSPEKLINHLEVTILITEIKRVVS